jgi:hypothetical protein
VNRSVRLPSTALALWLLATSLSGRADEPIVIPSARPAAGGATVFVPSSKPGMPTSADPNGALSLAPSAAHSALSSTEAWHQRYDAYFRKDWGVEVLGVHGTSSGWMLAFKYRVLDPDKAGILNEKRSKAFVIDEATDVRLAVPAMENIGELRQTPRQEEGRIYYILFGNPNRLVKPGGHVDVVVGRFRADGVVVE